MAAKFRTGGLAAELFPTPVELAAVDRAPAASVDLFKLTAGLHHAIRHRDPETGFTHHGFVNVLAATLAARPGAPRWAARWSRPLAAADPVAWSSPLGHAAGAQRPLRVGYGSCSIAEPVGTDQARPVRGLTARRRPGQGSTTPGGPGTGRRERTNPEVEP